MLYCVLPNHQKTHEEQFEVLRILLTAGADVNLPTAAGGLAPLGLASWLGWPDMVAALLAAGARPSLTAEWGTEHEPGFNTGPPVECWRRTAKPRSFRCLPMLLAAGSPLPRPERTAYMLADDTLHFDADARDYVEAAARAGGFPNYQRAHVARVAAILETPLLPPELVRHVVSFWLHAGWYLSASV